MTPRESFGYGSIFRQIVVMSIERFFLAFKCR